MMTFRQFLSFLTSQEVGAFCNRSDGGVQVVRMFAMIDDRIDPNDPQTALALDHVLTPGRLADLQAYAPAPVVDFLAFLDLFTPAEQASILNATDIAIKRFVIQAAGQGQIDLSDARLSSALDYLTAANVLAAGRKAQILANQTPGA